MFKGEQGVKQMNKDEYREEVLKELRKHNENLERIKESNAAIAISTFCSMTLLFFILIFVIIK